MGYLHTNVMKLTELFLIKVKQFGKFDNGKIDCPDNYKARIIGEVEDLLRRGVPANAIESKMIKFNGNPKTVYGVKQLIEVDKVIPTTYKYPKEEDECVFIPMFYFHPELQESPIPGRHIMNWKTMDLRYEEPKKFYLEIVDSFTLRDVAHYFLKRTQQLDEMYKLNMLAKQFKVIVERYGLDLTLYLIDTSAMDSIENDRPMPTFPMAMTDSAPLAEEMYRTRKLIAKEGGLNHVIPKS